MHKISSVNPSLHIYEISTLWSCFLQHLRRICVIWHLNSAKKNETESRNILLLIFIFIPFHYFNLHALSFNTGGFYLYVHISFSWNNWVKCTKVRYTWTECVASPKPSSARYCWTKIIFELFCLNSVSWYQHHNRIRKNIHLVNDHATQ